MPDPAGDFRGELRDYSSEVLLRRMTSYCERSKVVAMKSISLLHGQHKSRLCETESVSNLDYLMRKYKNAKVIHLVRHPYEVHNSRSSLNWGDVDTENSCAASERDYKLGSGQWDTRYMVVRYQDLLTSPESTIAHVHRFMNLVPDQARIRATVAEHILLPGTEEPDANSAMRYNTKREKMKCEACGAEVDEKLPPVCGRLVESLDLLCCSAANR